MKFAVDNGMLDLSYVQEQIEMQKREELLKTHPYKIWEGKDGIWKTYLPDKEKGRILRKRNTAKEIEEVVADYWKEECENPTIKEVFDEWNDRRLSLEKISPSTHLRNNQIFNRHYKSFGNKKIKSVAQEDIGDFLEEQIHLFDLTAKAFSNLKGITRGFLKRAKKRKLISFNIEEMFDNLDVSDTEFKKTIKEDYEEVFSEDEMPVIIEYLESHIDIWNLGILLMFVTGARVGEVVTLKKEVFNGNSFNIRRTETRFKKDGEYVCEVKEFPKSDAGVRTVLIPTDYEWIIWELKKLNPFSEYIFEKDGKRLTAQCLRMRLKRICKKLNIYHKSPHKIRKTYGTILLDNNVDNRLIMGQMGHTDILCTEKHYHRNRRSLDVKTAIINALPDFKVNHG